MSARAMTGEGDLWQHFWDGDLPAEGPSVPGNRMLLVAALEVLLRTTDAKGRIRRIKLTDERRWYRVFSAHIANLQEGADGLRIEQVAVLPQSRLFDVGMVIDGYVGPRSARLSTDVFVEYLGPLPGNDGL
jgi:hypothetical protein